MREELLSGLVLAAALAVAPPALAGTASAQDEGCRYYYTSLFPGPNGETKGYGDYTEGDADPEGRVCRDGWWSNPEGGQNPWDPGIAG
ncbi:hypothetical protein [Actinosynnema mirum]|uniref:Uncharacterized protein n=1 Tax=Actinosynnema mirum (strain ATCC 29888 / DSM 43827 / JCM 3225 / NBRC 14064 / NCIMB 13271 / NRRL B-12336 / IMRU 3971 / 101) TaxID=446462 RepID=C6W9N1_ACTMD|nr:hypothetical protein [Actinosynnema mirum]ACU37248.1 hypothetical protein Amir_3346 [Actinosynnema mirum DSM 43827]